MNVIEKIRKLRAKAANAVSTEAEVQAALDTVAKLMKRHGVTESDIRSSSKSGLKPVVWRGKNKSLPEVRFAATAIGAFTETKAWQSQTDSGEVIKYLGMEQDVEMALYLTDLVNNAITGEWKRFCEGEASAYIGYVTTSQRAKLKRDFCRAMAARIRARLMDMTAKRVADKVVTTGTDLVVLKRDVIATAQAELGLKLKDVKTRRRKVYTRAHDAGDAAGRRVNLTKGIAA